MTVSPSVPLLTLRVTTALSRSAGGFVVRASAIRDSIRVHREMAVVPDGRLALGARPERRRLCRVRSTSFLVCYRVAGVCAHTSVVIVVLCLVVSSHRSHRSVSEEGKGTPRSSIVRRSREIPAIPDLGSDESRDRGNNGKTEKRSAATYVKVRSPMCMRICAPMRVLARARARCT